jgi:TRAP-type C4-dicarboxylate transport system substrate-binding protein
MKRITLGAVVAMTFALLVLAASAQAAVTLRFSTCLAKTHDQVETYFQGFYEPFNKMAKGEAKLHYVGGPEVTPRQKQAVALKRGLVDMIFCPMGYFEGTVAEAGLTSVTNLSTKILRENGAIDQLQPAWKAKMNGRILGWCCYGVDFHIYTTFVPKQSDKTGLDLTGHKMRSTATYNPFFKAMGAIPINMSASEMQTGLSRGVAEGIAWPEGALVKYGVQKILKYRVYPGFYRSGSMVVVNLDKWKTLPKSVQDMLNKQGLAFEENSITILRKKADIDNAKLWAAGMKKIELKGEARKAYLRTVYELAWEARKDANYTVPFAKLREKMYREP